MLALVVAVAATIVLTQPVRAAEDYTVWSSVVLVRTGERTPLILDYEEFQLSPDGAQQAYDAGQFLRTRYVTGNSTTPGAVAQIAGLAQDILNNVQLYASALDWQFTSATAQAFIQGLYPPTGTVIETELNPMNISYNQSPLSGYQYAQIHTVGPVDPNFLYLSANLYCPAFDMATADYYTSQAFLDTQRQSKQYYEAIGSELLADLLPDPTEWDFANAYTIYDYLSYQNVHNGSFAAKLARYQDYSTNTSYLEIFRWLADEQQYAMLGNLSATNDVSHTSLPGDIGGSISTIAGNMFATKILIQMQNAIKWSGESFKLNLLFTDYAPFMSFFALTRLPESASGTSFYGLPDFASVATFELFSYTNGSTDTPFPDESDLWVRFYFRNGTDADEPYRSYSLFDRGPDSPDMTWAEFEASMYSIALTNVGDWCLQCGAENLFCAAWNASDGATSLWSGAAASGASGASQPKVNGVIGGVIGAMVTLAIAVVLFAGALLLGCVRVQAVPLRKQTGEMGGFKGGRKMASDQDLTIPKGGAVVQSSVEQEGPMSPAAGGHERMGSWELKEAEANGQNDARDRRVASSETERGLDPFADPVLAKETV